MIRRLMTLAALCVLSFTVPASAQQETGNVAAFARLYGVARWFYPSDGVGVTLLRYPGSKV